MYYVHKDDWSESHNYDYWNINFTSATNVNNTDVIKTIYDPSVSGFSLPKTAACSNFSTNAGTKYVDGKFMGRYFYRKGSEGATIFFDLIGYRETWDSYGALYGTTYRGFYWLSGKISSYQAISLFFDSSIVTSFESGGAWGYCQCSSANMVRPVTE